MLVKQAWYCIVLYCIVAGWLASDLRDSAAWCTDEHRIILLSNNETSHGHSSHHIQ